jgi:hypothetical protein
MQCIIGRDFGSPKWVVSFTANYVDESFNFALEEFEPPYRAKKFTRTEVAHFRDFLTEVIEKADKYERIKAELNQPKLTPEHPDFDPN